MAIAVPIGRRRSRDDAGGVTAALYKSHGAELLRFAWHRLGRLEDAEDAVQSAFLSAHRALSDGEDVREPRAWLFHILRNECLTRIAMTKRRGPHSTLEEWHEDASPGVEEQVERRDEFDTAVALLASLPDPQRDALVLREWVGLSAIETAEVIESTPQGVDALVYRARKALITDPETAEGTTCADVREALADGTLKARGRAHLTTCRSCRSAARRLRSPEELAAARGLLPFDAVGAGLAQIIPGFTLAAAGIAVAGGATAAAATAGSTTAAGGTAAGAGASAGAGTAAAGTATATGVAGTTAAATGVTGAAAAAGIGTKVVATVAVGAAVAGGTAVAVPPVREAIVPIVTQDAQRSPVEPPATQQGALTLTVAETPRTSGVPAGTARDATAAGGRAADAASDGGGVRAGSGGGGVGSDDGAGIPPQRDEPPRGDDAPLPAVAGVATTERPQREEPARSEQPDRSDKPGKEDPPKAEKPEKPGKEDPPKADKPDKPGKEDPPKADKPDKPDKPEKPEKPETAEPPKPEKPEKPAKPEDVGPPKPEKPAKPEDAGPPKPEKPEKPETAEPPKPEKPEKPEKPGKSDVDR